MKALVLSQFMQWLPCLTRVNDGGRFYAADRACSAVVSTQQALACSPHACQRRESFLRNRQWHARHTRFRDGLRFYATFSDMLESIQYMQWHACLMRVNDGSRFYATGSGMLASCMSTTAVVPTQYSLLCLLPRLNPNAYQVVVPIYGGAVQELQRFFGSCVVFVVVQHDEVLKHGH